ncbi:hypothetical protein ONZ45_g906 [Pleurotus djamor]|nr:hypothetical protein ONZ45_g906 [Pleurotus djamor]
MLYAAVRSLSLTAVLLLVPTLVQGSGHSHNHDLHARRVGLHKSAERNWSRRQEDDGGLAERYQVDWRRDGEDGSLQVRADNARFTWYNPGLGACGKVHGDGDAVVAMNTPDWDGGSHCFKSVTINYKGKSTSAIVVDRCVGCPQGALDLSPSVFSRLTSIDDGEIQGSWSFGSGAPPPDPKPEPKPEPPPKSESKPSPSPSPSPPPPPPSPSPTPTTTSTHTTKHTTTTTSEEERPTSSVVESTTEVVSSASESVSASVSSSSEAPVATISPDDPQVINQVNVAILRLGAFVYTAASVAE